MPKIREITHQIANVMCANANINQCSAELGISKQIDESIVNQAKARLFE